MMSGFAPLIFLSMALLTVLAFAADASADDAGDNHRG
jgi:hypothetical protein